MAVDPKKKGPYHGMAIYFIVDILASFLVFIIVNGAMMQATKISWDTQDIVFWQSFVFGIGVGLVLTLSVFISGGLREPFIAVKERVACFIEDCKISFKEGVKWWWYRVKTEGIALWVLITFFLLQVLLLIKGIVTFADIYGI